MTLAVAKRIVARLGQAGLSAELREDYVGRGMSRGTAAIVLRSSCDMSEAQRTCRSLKTKRTDSMGLGVVYY